MELEVSQESRASQDAIVKALTDFSAHRAELFPNVDTDHLQVHSVGAGEADVTEGSSVLGGIWERNHYDWSTPGVLKVETTDSNTWANGSSWFYRFTDRPGGGTVVHLHVTRVPKTAKGRFVALALRLGGRRRFGRELRRVLDGIDAAAG